MDTGLGDADYYTEDQYAGIGRRILTQLIDPIVLIVLCLLLWVPFGFLYGSGLLKSNPAALYVAFSWVLIWCYLCPLKRSVGTVAYRLLGLKIVLAAGGQPSLFIMTARMALWIFGPVNFVLDNLWLGADSERQSLRDSYLGTYVVRRAAQPIGRGPVEIVRYFSCGFAFAYPRVRRPRGK